MESMFRSNGIRVCEGNLLLRCISPARFPIRRFQAVDGDDDAFAFTDFRESLSNRHFSKCSREATVYEVLKYGH